MPVIKLSQGLLESLNSRGKDKEDFFDSTTKGLMVQVRASGRKTYYFRERGEDGKTIQLKIADADAIRLNAVRELIKQRRAAQAKAALATFANPMAEALVAPPLRTRGLFTSARNLCPRSLPSLYKDIQTLVFLRRQPAE